MAIEKLSSSWKYHQIKEIEYSEKPEHKKVGRPNTVGISDVPVCTFAAHKWTGTNEQFNRGTSKDFELFRSEL